MTWLILDVILILILVISFAINHHRGFVSALLGIGAVVISLVLAFFLSEKLAEPIYEDYVREPLIAMIDKKIDEQGTAVLEGSIGELSGLLGADEALQNFVAQGTDTLAEQIVDELLGSGIRAAIRALLLLLIYIVASLLLRFVAKAMQGLNDIPLLGGANKALGGVLGLCVGALYCYLLVSLYALVIQLSMNSLSWLNTGIIDQTILTSLIYPYNLVAVLM